MSSLFFRNLYLKMQKNGSSDSNQYGIRKKMVKSVDLKKRLFEVGLNNSPTNLPSSALNTLSSPKHGLLSKYSILKDNSSHILKYQPSLTKTHSHQFNIRKTPRHIFSPSNRNNQCTTLSSFYKPDLVRDESGKKTELRQALLDWHEREKQDYACDQQKEYLESKLDEYVNLVLRGVEHIDEFLYLIRGSEQNIYQLQLAKFQSIREHEGEINFQYYTVSKKGFCQYVGGKPQSFIQIIEWADEKTLYTKIKALNFFHRFRRWKTLQMWRRTVTRQRREAISHSLLEKLFLLDSNTRKTILELRRLTIDLERSVLIIAKNEGTYTLESFKHCQQRTRREASLSVEQFSRQSRSVVRKCFQNKLSQLRQMIKKNAGQERPVGTTGNAQSLKEGAFQSLGFPTKMTYEHRSRLRKEAGRFLRFSYFVDSLHLSCLTGLYNSQVSAFISRLQELQLNEKVKERVTLEEGKDEAERQKMLVLQLGCSFKEVPERLTSQSNNGEEWLPISDIRLKGEEPRTKMWVPRLCQYWLNFQPTIDQVLDEFAFLLREGLGSLKCFQRWAKHRQMQKYVDILEEWDDLVSQNWEISQNDNLDPLPLIDSLDPALSRLKYILKETEIKLFDNIRSILTDLLNAYWVYSQLPLLQLQNQALLNPADTFEQFLQNTTNQLDKITNSLPHRIELGVFSIQITRIKGILGQYFAGVLQNFKIRLPELIEDRTTRLNEWLLMYGTKLRQQILNIDDYVKMVQTTREIDGQFNEYREECNQLGQIYQIMQKFRIDTKKRKDFETVTLKLKDQLDQLLLNAQQNIERKADLYTRQVQKYHLPALVKDITKALQSIEQPKFLRLDSNRNTLLSDLNALQERQCQLQQQRDKCQNYLKSLKLTPQAIEQLDELEKEINSRKILWTTLDKWDHLTQLNQNQSVKSLQLSTIIQKTLQFYQIGLRLDGALPPNQVLNFLNQSVGEYHIHLPLLIGFSQPLSQNHWAQINDILPQKLNFDLKRREFTLINFLRSGVGQRAKEIQAIFQKSRVQAKLQKEYHQLQEKWSNLIAKIRIEGRFSIISNAETLRSQLNQILFSLVRMLANPHAQALRQYSISYQSLYAAQQALQTWIHVQDKMVDLQKQCRLLDVKKLQDYNFFENAQRIYKQISKPMQSKGSETGVRFGKLLMCGIEDKFTQINSNIQRVQDNIKIILQQHRRIFPSFYLFTDYELLQLITEPTHTVVQNAAIRLIPVLDSLEFQAERISAIVTIDGDRLIKNPISMNAEIEQILLLVVETASEMHRRFLRNCRYKAVENSLCGLIEQYNIQHLLAVSRVDFSHYTTISIENQQDSPDSLSQFRKVMRKDTAEDIQNRPAFKESKISTVNINTQKNNQNNSTIIYNKQTVLQKYDTLLLQQLLYEQILDFLIKSNVEKPQDYAWVSQLKFFWEDSPADEPNINVRQLLLSLKYGNEFLGSKSKVILQSQAEVLLGLRLSQNIVYKGNYYSLERLVNGIGYKMLTFTASPLISETNLRKFIIGCYFGDYFPLILASDLLNPCLRREISTQKWVDEFKQSHLKRNSPYLKDTEKIHSVFLTMRDSNLAGYLMGNSLRVITYSPPKQELLKSGMRLLNLFGNERTSLLLRIFESVQFFEERSHMQGISVEQFLDLVINLEEQINQHRLFSHLLGYLKPKVNLATHQALSKHLQSLGLLPLDQISSQRLQNNNDKISDIIDCLWERRVLVLTGRGLSQKYLLRRQLNKINVEFVQVYGESIRSQDILDSSNLLLTFQNKLNDSQNKQVIYLQAPTTHLLLGLQKLLYMNPLQTPNVFSSQTAFVVDLSSVQNLINPRSLSSFATIHCQLFKEYITCVSEDWPLVHLPQDQHKLFNRLFSDVIFPTIQSLTPNKDDLIIEQKVTRFLHLLQSLLPVNNLLQAVVYCLLLLYRGCEEEQLKLEYLVKKQLGEEKLPEGTRITQLIYSKEIKNEGLVSQNNYFDTWLTQRQIARDLPVILTPQYMHSLIITRRIHQNTNFGVCIQGKSNCGKSTALILYRSIYHESSFFLKIATEIGSGWSKKLSNTLQRHGLNLIGARINYKQTILMVDDVHLSDRQNLIQLQLMANYKKCEYQGKKIDIQNVKFMLTSRQLPQILKKSTIKISINLTTDQLKGIFTTILTSNVDQQWNVSPLLIQKISNNSFDLCKRIIQSEKNRTQAFSVLKRIINSFSKLKLKEGSPIQKQIQKFWAFALLEGLKPYDTEHLLQEQLNKLQLFSHHSTALSYTHLCTRITQKRVQSLRDPKKLYNMLNERIQKYNEGDSKRYGQSFEFINFDSILEKIVCISHSVLLDSDHLICGRKGTGKESLVRLTAFLNGLLYKQIKGSIKCAVTDLIDSCVTSPYLLFKRILDQADHEQLKQYYLCDFESQILTHDLQKPKVFISEKEKASALKTTKHSLPNSSDSFTMPKPKLTLEDVLTYKKSFRVVLSSLSSQQIANIPPSIRANFHLDFIEQVPAPSIILYNEKLLAVDGISCSKDAQIIMSQIYEFSREELGISLRENDDCVRLFSSFLANLVSEMTLEAERYSKILQLLARLRTTCHFISKQVTDLHSQLKQLSIKGQSFQGSKSEIQSQLRQKSTALSAGQKLSEILNWLQSSYQVRYNSINDHLKDRNQLELTFAITATYFIYLSNLPFSKRRQIFDSWYESVPLMKNLPSKRIKSFLSLFLLYEEQFNAEPVDDLPDFYENMAIIFHSAKPIAIRDDSWRGKLWLQKNCSFLYLREDDKQFYESITDYLGKPSNILIEVVKQSTLDNLNDTPIGTLLFLPESTEKINLRGEDIQVHHEAKVYLLLGKGIVVPRQLKQEFTEVLFSESKEMFETSLTHEYLCHFQREHQMTRLDWHRKIRNLKLDCDNAIGQVAESIYDQLCGSESPPAQALLCDKLSKITDKLMVRAQNQFTKIKDKEDLIKDFQQKYDKVSSKIITEPALQFYTIAKKIRTVLTLMSQSGTNRQKLFYYDPPFSEFYTIIKIGLSKGLIKSIPAFIMFVLRQWGPMYSKPDYLVFALLLVAIIRGKQPESVITAVTEEGLKKGLLLALISNYSEALLSESQIEDVITQTLIDLVSEDPKALEPLMFSRDTPLVPVIWLQEENIQNIDQKIVRIHSLVSRAQIKQKIVNMHSRVIEPSNQQPLETLLKKNTNDQLQVLIFGCQSMQDTCKLLKNWGFGEKSIVFLYDSHNCPWSQRIFEWKVQLDNEQSIFINVMNHFVRKNVQISEDIGMRVEKQREDGSLLENTLPPQLTSQPSQCQTIPAQMSFPMMQNQNTHHHAHHETIDYENDKCIKILQLFVCCIKEQHFLKGLPVPQVLKSQLINARKMVQTQDTPLTFQERIHSMTRCIGTTLKGIVPEMETYIQNLVQKMCHISSRSEQQLISQYQIVLAQGRQYQQPDHRAEKQLAMQLGWLIKTRKTLNLDRSSVLLKYLLKIQNYIIAIKSYKQSPKIVKEVKKQQNIRIKRQSSRKNLGRVSTSQSKKLQFQSKANLTSKLSSNEFASLHLLKETQKYDQLIGQILIDLQQAKKQLEAAEQTMPSQSTITLLLNIAQDKTISCWKIFLSDINCQHLPLSVAIRTLISRRNDLFSYHSKLLYGDPFEIDFKFIRKPAEFLRAYFRSELTSQDIFIITNSVNSEEAERADCLKVAGMWGLGWRLSNQGVLENMGDGKAIQLSSCLIIKRTNLTVGSSFIDLMVSPESKVPLMRVYSLSKKGQNSNISNKLFLRMQN